MRITHTEHGVTIRDRPAPFWALGLFLLAGGLVALAMPLGLAADAAARAPWERLASLAIGLGVSAGALWWLAQNPASRVDVQPAARLLRLTTTGIRGRRVRTVPFDAIAGVEIERSADTSDGAVWRPAVRLRDGELLPLSRLWLHGELGPAEMAGAVSDACRVPLLR